MYKSPLLKTVQRHTSITAVTHAPVHVPIAPGVEQEQNLLPAGPAGTSLPVKASWVPTPAKLGELIPTTPPIPGEGEQTPIQPLPEKLDSSSVPAETKKVEPAHPTEKDTSLPQNVSDEDNLWRRLQTIFNRHQEKEQQEDSLETDTRPDEEKRTEPQLSEQNSKPADASQTARSTGSTSSSDKTAGPVQRKEATPQQKRTDNLPTAPMHTGEAATQSEKEEEPQTKEKSEDFSLTNLNSPTEVPVDTGNSEVTPKPITEKPAIQSQAVPQTTFPPRSESLSEIPFTSDDAKVAAETRETQSPKSKISLDSSATEALGSEPENASDEGPTDNLDKLEDNISIHPSPLQSVWPVLEKAARSEFRETTQPSSPSQTDAAYAYNRTALSQDFGQIQSRLEKVRTTPSDSSIEYIPPRRPRPSSLAEQPTKPADLVQRQLEDKNLDTQPVQPAAENRPFDSTSAVGATQLSSSVDQEAHTQVPEHKRPIIPAQPVQRFKDESGSPGMVGTEFGDLPADLWQLIGEKPPAHLAAPPETIQTPVLSGPKQMHSSSTQVMRSPVGSSSGQDESQSPQAQTIQRQTEQSTASTQAAPGTEPAPREDQEVDIQELAKKVYSEIKQKLTLEWERRRF